MVWGKRAIAAAIFALLVAASGPSIASVLISGPVGTETAVAIDAMKDEVTYAFTIVNTATTDAKFQIVAGTAKQTGGLCNVLRKDRCALHWQYDGQSLTPDAPPRAFILKPGEVKSLVLSGNLPHNGIYEAPVTITDVSGSAPQAPVVKTIRINRKLPDLGTAPLTVSTGARFSVPFHDQKLSIDVTNSMSQTVSISAPPRVEIFADSSGDGTFLVVSGTRDGSCSAVGKPDGQVVAIDAEHPAQLDPQHPLKCTAMLDGLSPGHYSATVTIPETSATPATSKFTVRYDWWIALLALLIPAWIGTRISNYESSGRRRMLQAIDLLRFADALKEIVAPATSASDIPDTQGLVAAELQRIGLSVEQLRTDDEAEKQSLVDELRLFVPQLQRFAALEAGARAHALESKTEYATALKALQSKAATTDAELDALADIIKKDAAAMKNLRAMVTADAPLFNAWGPGIGYSDLNRMVSRIDGLIKFSSATLAVLIGLVGLWVPNLAWGSIPDIAVAILTGFGITLSGTVSLKKLTENYALPSLPAGR